MITSLRLCHGKQGNSASWAFYAAARWFRGLLPFTRNVALIKVLAQCCWIFQPVHRMRNQPAVFAGDGRRLALLLPARFDVCKFPTWCLIQLFPHFLPPMVLCAPPLAAGPAFLEKKCWSGAYLPSMPVGQIRRKQSRVSLRKYRKDDAHSVKYHLNVFNKTRLC